MQGSHPQLNMLKMLKTTSQQANKSSSITQQTPNKPNTIDHKSAAIG